MRSRYFVGAAAVVMVSSGLFGTAAEAAGPPYLGISPNPVAAGGVVRVSSLCHSPQPHIAVSAGFVAPIPTGESGRVVNKPGKYSVSMKCGGGSLTTTFTIEAGPSISVRPKEVQPGGSVNVQVTCPGGVSPLKATSPGFVDDVPIKISDSGVGTAVGKAVSKLGRYTVTVQCKDKRLVASFAVVAPGKPNPPAQPQVPVKPKAAPQTGGGFLAGSQ